MRGISPRDRDIIRMRGSGARVVLRVRVAVRVRVVSLDTVSRPHVPEHFCVPQGCHRAMAMPHEGPHHLP